MAGRKPTPTALRVLRGNPSRRPLPTAEPKVEAIVEIPHPPRHLNRRAAACWRKLVGQLIAMRSVTKADLIGLEGLCSAYATFAEADEEIEKEGLTIASPQGRRAHPLLAVRDAAMKQIRAFSAEFGLSPSSRARIRAIPTVPEKSRFQQLFDGEHAI